MHDAIFQVFGKVEPHVVEEMMAVADTDRNGEISLDEFKSIMRAGPRALGKTLHTVVRGMTDPDQMQVMLRNAREGIEEVDVWLRLRGEAIDTATKAELQARRAPLEEQVTTLTGMLSAIESEKAEEVDLEAAAAAAAAAEAAKATEGNCGEYTKMAVTILKNTISGVLTIYLYFMDLISDYQVALRSYSAPWRSPNPRATAPSADQGP